MLSVGYPTPTPEDVAAARDEAGMTQQQAAAVVHATREAWKSWEAGRRAMPAGLFELFCMKTGVDNPYAPDQGHRGDGDYDE